MPVGKEQFRIVPDGSERRVFLNLYNLIAVGRNNLSDSSGGNPFINVVQRFGCGDIVQMDVHKGNSVQRHSLFSFQQGCSSKKAVAAAASWRIWAERASKLSNFTSGRIK